MSGWQVVMLSGIQAGVNGGRAFNRQKYLWTICSEWLMTNIPSTMDDTKLVKLPHLKPVLQRRRRLFISYHHSDRVWVDRLKSMMAPMRITDQDLLLWDDSAIPRGEKWREAIQIALAEANLALLFVSASFLSSEFVMNEEVPKLLEAAELDGVPILWVSVRPSLVEFTPIHAYQAVLPPNCHLAGLDPIKQEEALITIALAIKEAKAVQRQGAVVEVSSPMDLKSMPLDPVTIRVPSAKLLRNMDGWRLERDEVTAQALLVELERGVSLTMLRIPEGEFNMGSPQEELERYEDEGPQVLLRPREFWLGQTPITQEQWRVVAQWTERGQERWGRDLKANPSFFQARQDRHGSGGWLLGDEETTEQRPVEQVGWEDAMEFCHRLSQRTGLSFSLPSEAQWEYACRAGTTTPFAFGETLTTELANYDGEGSYANGPKGKHRKQTTRVGSFPANAWGLQDMHGNVWEWCLDHSKENHEGAPEDGSARLNKDGDQGCRRVLRGGSWNDGPEDCRSAYRDRDAPDHAKGLIGFRVACLHDERFSRNH